MQYVVDLFHQLQHPAAKSIAVVIAVLIFYIVLGAIGNLIRLIMGKEPL